MAPDVKITPMPLRIATWNVNSIKSRLEHVKSWLEKNAPDVLLLQELKGLDFPDGEFAAMGYKSAAVTQKAYNGVAILSRSDIDIVLRALPGSESDEQARYLEADTGGLRVVCLYLPNGNPVDSDKFPYKLSWMDRLARRFAALREEGVAFAAGGDYNVIPGPADCYDPAAWQSDALFHPETRRRFRALLNLGLYDAFRVRNRSAGQYTYWDYQGGAWQAGKGIRIDHFLLSPPVADRLVSCDIDTAPRGLDKASDHTPLLVELR